MFKVKGIKGYLLVYSSFLSKPQDSRVHSLVERLRIRLHCRGGGNVFFYMWSLKSNYGRPLRGDKALALCAAILHLAAGINLHLLARFATANSEFSRTYDGSACHKSFSHCCASGPYKRSTYLNSLGFSISMDQSCWQRCPYRRTCSRQKHKENG